jgi:hypothetical protein
MEGQIENFAPGDNFTPREQTSPLGSNFAPKAKLRMASVWSLRRLRNNYSTKDYVGMYVFTRLYMHIYNYEVNIYVFYLFQ